MQVRSSCVALGVVVLGVASAPVAHTQFRGAGPSGAQHIVLPNLPLSGPYFVPLPEQKSVSLFPAPDVKQPALPNQSVERRAPRVVCGMTQIPAPPMSDSKAGPTVKRKPDDRTYTIRPVQPPMCWDDPR